MATLRYQVLKYGQAEIKFKYTEKEELKSIPENISISRVKDSYAWALISAFDLDDMNFRLKKIPRIYKQCYEDRLEPTQRSIDLIERKYLKK